MEKFVYNIGKLSVTIQEFFTPKVNWVVPFVVGMVVYHFI